jgi:hypothetical protein
MVQLALYCGPPRGHWRHIVSHYAIRLWTWSRYSHAELVIDGVCYSSSARDGGVREKVIDLGSGRWEVFPIPAVSAERPLQWFAQHVRQAYDWSNIGRFVLPFLPHRKNQWVCFEAVGAMLNLAAAHKLTANDLRAWVLAQAREAPGAPR